MEAIIPILVQLIAGGAGGNVIGQVVKSLNMGPIGNSIIGAIGGVAATWLAGMIPGLDGLVGAAASMAGDAAGAGADAAAGGLDIGALLGQGATGLVGGGVLTAIAGLVKSQMAKG